MMKTKSDSLATMNLGEALVELIKDLENYPGHLILTNTEENTSWAAILGDDDAGGESVGVGDTPLEALNNLLLSIEY